MNERLEELASRFFGRIVELCPKCAPADFVVVTHLLEDRPWFLSAVSKLGRIAAVIPKRKSIVPRVREVLRHVVPLLDVSRADLASHEGLRRHLAPLQRRDTPFCLLDIGGYFAPLAEMDASAHGLNVCGIVEDTENGHVKYERIIAAKGGPPMPIYSVARSELKRPENFLVGQSLVYSVEAILRKRDELLHGRRACVIGYGNIGRSVAAHLHERHVAVTVFDANPMKMIEAFTHGFHTPNSLKDALQSAEIVFCVTGSQSMGLEEFSCLRPYAYVATVTSPDDEFRMDELNVSISHRDGHISEMHFPGGKTVYLMNRGQAVNFVHGSVVGPFIQLLQAEILLTATAMLARERPRGIGVISDPEKRAIADAWLQVYRH